MEKNFNTRQGEGLIIEGNDLEEIKEKQKKGIIKANNNNDYDRTWSKEEAESWLEINDFYTNRYEEMSNWHSFRQNDPDKYDEIRTDTSPFDFDEEDGVHAMMGIWERDDGDTASEVQSIRFYHGGDD